jgi:hypothetical protein
MQWLRKIYLKVIQAIEIAARLIIMMQQNRTVSPA